MISGNAKCSDGSITAETSGEQVNNVVDIQAIRSQMVDKGLMVFAVVVPLAITFSLLRTVQHGWHNTYYLQMTIAVILVAAAVFRHRLPYLLRVGVLLGLLLTIAVQGLFVFGVAGNSMLGLGMFSVLSAILLGRRAGLYSIVISLALIALFGVLVCSGLVVFPFDPGLYLTSWTTWAMGFVAFILLTSLVVTAFGILHEHLVGSINSLHASDKALRTSEERYRVLVEHAPEAIVVLDANTGKFIDANDNACRLYALSREELLRTGPVELSPPNQPDGRPSAEVAQEMIAKASKGEEAVFEWVHRNAVGNDIDCEVHLILLPFATGDLIRGSIIDITEKKQAEEALRKSEERFRDLFENANDLIQSVRPDGTFAYVNPAWSATLGYSAEEASNMAVLDIIHPDSKKHYMKIFERVIKGENLNDVETVFVAKNGKEVAVEGSTGCLFENGKPIATRGIFRDITKHKHLEDQLRQAQKMEAIGQLAGGVAHDFNNLLQVISGYGQMALEESEGKKGHQELEEVMKAADRAATLVRQLLAFSRRQVLELEVLNLGDVVGDLSKMIRRVIGEHIAFTVHSDPGLKMIRADKGQLEQILMNLCVNARDAMPEGGALTIDAANTEMDEEFCKENTWAKPGKYVVLAVTDTGDGMDEQTKNRIFEPFFTTKEMGKGTGLGLSTVFGIVRQHDGMIHVYSEVGVGTTFRIYLPMIENSEAASDDLILEAPPGGTETILLAEDDEAVLDLAKRLLVKAGYTVLCACDGEEAIRVFDERTDEIGLALLDVVMPKLGGGAVFEHIRGKRPQIPVLFASGYSTEAVHTNFVLDEGVQRIQKPYRSDDLLRKIRAVLDS